MHQPPRVQFLDPTTPPHIVTLVLITGFSALVMNIFVPSLQVMADHFGTSYGLMQLSVSLYLGVNAVLQLFIGPLSDAYGRRPVILWGGVLFMLATLGCLMAPDIVTFLVFRMMQAVIVVGMVLGRAVVRDLYPPDEAASRIGYVTMGMALVPLVSPVIGGALTEWINWQASFWFMFAVGGALIWLCWRDLGETGQKRDLSLTHIFDDTPQLLRSPRFWGYSITLALSSGAFFSYIGGGAFVGSEVFGLSTWQVGLLFGVPALGYATGNYVSGRFSARYGINRMVIVGTAILVSGLVASILVFATGFGTAYSFFGFMCFVGLGNGLVIPNAVSGAMSVRPHLAGTASGLSGAIMLAGGAVLSALAGQLLTPSAGAWPLLWLMLATSVGAVIAIILVIRRERHLARMDAAP